MMQNFWLLVLSIFILGLGFSLHKKYTKPYKEFPTFPMMLYLAQGYLFRRMHVPLMSYAFKKLVELSKKYEADGVFLVWCPEPQLFIFSEEAVKIFSNEKSALDKANKYEIMKDVFGNGTVTSNGDTWRNRRKMFNPVFYKDMLKSKIYTCNEYSRLMVEDLEKLTTKTVHVLDYIKKCSFGIICETLLGVDVQEEKAQACLRAITKLCECTSYRMSHPLMRYKILLNCTAYGTECLKWYKERSRLLSEALLAIKESASFTLSEGKPETEVGKSFAQILIEHHLNDPDFTMEHMEDEISTYLASGYDTVSYSMMWSLFLLGHHEDVQNRVFKEVQSETEEFISYNDTCKLRYLECVIKESLRLYPPVPLFSRHLKEDVQCGKYKVPKDTSIVFFPYRLHRNSEIFPDPENFNPDRFLDGTLMKHPWSYVPFSEGIRNCIGKKFAMMEMKIVLAYIIRNFHVKSLDEREKVELNWEVTLMPSKPLYMQLVPRK